MASTYVNNLRLNEMATGDGSGTWGTTTNTNLELIGQALGYGTRAIANASTDNITIADGASDSDRAMYLKLTAGGQACTVTLLPNTASKVWMMENATSYTLTFTCGSGANVAILAGETKVIATDGAGSGGVVYDVLTDTNLAGTTKTAALTNAGALSNQGTLTVGVDDTGYDVKLFGATSGAYMLWDESADDLKLVGAAGFTVAGNIDVDGTANLDIVDIDGAVDMASTLAVAGVLTGASLDISGDIDIDGTSNLDVVDIDGAVDMATTLAVAGNVDFNGDLDVDGTTNLDVVDVDGAVNFAADVTYADGADIITASAGTSNVRVGVNAGNSIASGGNYNVVVGDEAGTALTTGDNNTFVGYTAGDATTTAGNNTAVGYNSLSANTEGHSNTAVGYNSLAANTTALYNTAVGRNALDATTTGASNVAIGYDALGKNVSNAANVAVGYASMEDANGSAYCTAMGYAAGKDLSTGDNNLCLGYNAGASASPSGTLTTESNEICLGNDAISQAHIQVDWTVASDQRDKTDFTALDLGLDFVKALSPVTYKWDKRSKYAEEGDDLDTVTHDGTHKEDWLDIGFKAQEVEALEIAAGYNKSSKTNLTTTLSGDGKQYGIQYSKFVPILVKAIQEQQTLIEALTARITTLEGE